MIGRRSSAAAPCRYLKKLESELMRRFSVLGAAPYGERWFRGTRLRIDDGGRRQRGAVLRPGDTDKPDERHDIFAVCAPSMARLPALDPGFEYRRHGKMEPLDAFLRLGCELPGKDWRQRDQPSNTCHRS